MTKVRTAALGILLLTSLTSPSRAHDMSAMGGANGAPMAMGAHLHTGEHMKMTELRPENPRDAQRARQLLSDLRQALEPYRDYRVALERGFKIFLADVPQDVYHFTDYEMTNAEYHGQFDVKNPGSLLYVKTGDDNYTLVGAMFSAPPFYTPDQLNELIPLSVARWHQHVDICLPKGITLGGLLRDNIGADQAEVPGMLPIAANPDALALNHRLGFMADGRFGFEGSIHDPATCNAAGGNFVPLAFGWMVHVYPFQGDDLKVAYGMKVPAVAP